MKYPTKEAINNIAMCSAILFFVPFAFSLVYILYLDKYPLAMFCFIIEIISVITMVITDDI